MSDKMRKEFEEYTKEKKYSLLPVKAPISKELGDTYEIFETQVAWEAWQAAYKASRHEELVLALHKLVYLSNVPEIAISERLQAQELLKSMEK